VSFDDDQLILIVTRVAAAVALLVALIFPLGYFIVGYSDLAATLKTRAEMRADEITQLITKSPQSWMFQEHLLKEALTRHAMDSEDRAAITGPKGELLLTLGDPPSPPALMRSHQLYESGQGVGHIRIVQSLRPIIAKTALAALLGLLLGGAVFFALKVLPLRALRRVTDALMREKERAEITLRSIGDAVVTVDAGESIEFLNPAAERLTGWPLTKAKGRPLAEVVRLVNENDGTFVESPLRRASVHNFPKLIERDVALLTPYGQTVSLEVSAAPIRHDDGKSAGGVLVIRDVSLARDFTQRLTWQATHDALTGLVNRLELENRIDSALASARNSAKHHVVCYMDLDQFKIVNDTCGHVAGDELLKQLAMVLLSKIRETDTLARLGGDEFGLLLEGCPLDRAQLIASDLLSTVRDYRFHWEDKMFNVGVSIGLVPVNADSTTRAEILSAADTACYLAKEQGRNRVAVFQGPAGEVADRHKEMGWVARIHQAMRENRLDLYYQNFLTVDQNFAGVNHIEVLLRMKDEEGKIVSPGSFLPAAERYNLMPTIDRWVVKTVFERFAAIEARLGDPRIMCAINLSGTSLNSEGFLDYIRPGSVCFELTETSAINNLRKAADFMKEGKAMGFHFALDDFGTGTSSFGYLKNLPVDYLKIDGGFVKDIMHDPIDKAMTETINRIGHIMGLKTVAEFAESEAIVGELRTIGVDFIQGYAVSKPAPLFGADAPALLRSVGIDDTLAPGKRVSEAATGYSVA
jgi:diguanylate cyclase (GGDEF)-like protein/PAS domain S-box-containing protein